MAASDAGEDECAVSPKDVHRGERDLRAAGRLEREVHAVARDLRKRSRACRRVCGADPCDQIATLGLVPTVDDRDVEAAQTEHECSQDPDGACAEDHGASRLPDGHPPLRRRQMAPTFLADRERFEQHGRSRELGLDDEEVLRPLGVALGTVAMEADDPALLICTPEAHIGLAPGAVRTTVGPPHARNHERARHQGARSALDATERFVPDHEELGTLRRRAVFTGQFFR